MLRKTNLWVFDERSYLLTLEVAQPYVIYVPNVQCVHGWNKKLQEKELKTEVYFFPLCLITHSKNFSFLLQPSGILLIQFYCPREYFPAGDTIVPQNLRLRLSPSPRSSTPSVPITTRQIDKKRITAITEIGSNHQVDMQLVTAFFFVVISYHVIILKLKDLK